MILKRIFLASEGIVETAAPTADLFGSGHQIIVSRCCGVVQIKNFEACSGDIAPKSMFSGSYSRLGNAIANRSRLTVAFFAVDPHAEFVALGPRLRLSETIL